MNFKKHLEVSGGHAIFGASQSAWLRYDEGKMVERVNSLFAKNLGTEIHEFARSQIDMKIRSRSIKSLKDSFMTYIYRKYFDEEKDCLSPYGEKLLSGISRMSKDILTTVQMYINDCIGYVMTTEQKLVYDPVYFFGTADAICYRDNILRIFDLKSGRLQAHMDQLLVYVAFFCLDYQIKPEELKLIDLRIYQNAQVACYEPSVEEIQTIMTKIIRDRKALTDIFSEGGTQL